ncbi:MAG: long-chain fatty acid--CoA ligase [Pseudomonadota bacterium]
MEKNLCSVLEDNLRSRGDKTALLRQGGSDTFRGIDGKASAIAAALLDRGLRPGQRVGIHTANIPEFVYAYFGVLKAGGQVVPINVMLKPNELAWLGRDSGLIFIVTQQPFVNEIQAARADIPSLREVFCVSPGCGGTTPFESLYSEPVSHIAGPANPEDVAVIFYTSGTTGHPKGAMLTHWNLCSNALATAETYEYVENDVIVFGMPMFHSSGQTNAMNAAFSRGAALVMIPRFTPDSVFDAFKSFPVSVFIGVPTMYHQILYHPEAERFASGNLRVCIVGAAAMPEKLFNDVAERYGVPITEGYGLSEAAPVVAHNPIRGVKKIGSVGIAVPGVSIHIVDEQDNLLPPGQVGELAVQGPNVMKGYLNQPEATSEALKGGLLHTGDLARMDEDGYLFIVDRKKDMILTGGFNIYPREVEEVLYTHPAVSEAAVIGLPDEEKGELACAYVILKSGCAASEEDIVAFCRERMAAYKAPRKVRFVGELPKSPSGKILKRLLKDR